MKIASSLKSLRKRDLNSKIVKRRGKIYVINKKNQLSLMKTIYISIRKHYKALPGNYCEGATPDPIPNSEVKSFSADGTLS